MEDKELTKIANLIKGQVSFKELNEFKQLELFSVESGEWVRNQIAKLDKGEILLWQITLSIFKTLKRI